MSVFGTRPGAGIAPDSVRLGPGRVVVSHSAAEELGVAAGDRVRLGTAGREASVAAVAGDASYAHTPVVWAALEDWQALARTGAAPAGPQATVVVLRGGEGVDYADGDRARARRAAPWTGRWRP